MRANNQLLVLCSNLPSISHLRYLPVGFFHIPHQCTFEVNNDVTILCRGDSTLDCWEVELLKVKVSLTCQDQVKGTVLNGIRKSQHQEGVIIEVPEDNVCSQSEYVDYVAAPGVLLI